MSLTYVNQQNFILQSLDRQSLQLPLTDLSFLLVKAKWCGHCVRYLPQYEQYSVKYPDINFLILESTDNELLLQQWNNLAHPAFDVRGFPTLVMYDQKGSPIKIVQDRFKLDDEINSYRS